MGNCSIYSLEKKVDKDYVPKKLKGYLSNTVNLTKFLFRSENTSEWVVGAKRLGKAAANDEDLRKYLEDSINDSENLHKRKKDPYLTDFWKTH